MNNFIRKIKKAPWVLAQPLTKIPKDKSTKISDLFIWRHSKNWQTFFELLDMPALFGSQQQHSANIVFFDQNGEQFYQESIGLTSYKRQTICLLDFIGKTKHQGTYGTFCIFHQQTPEIITELDSFITERGYLSYRYNNVALRSFVHGNFDAIGQEKDIMTLLGGRSFLKREYRLQYIFLPQNQYEIALVNTSTKTQKPQLFIKDATTQKIIEKIQASIKPKAVFICAIPNAPNPTRLVIKSKMIMARPVVFDYSDDKMNVFHG